MVFKVDFEKAFDSLNWELLDDMMGFMRFAAEGLNWLAKSAVLKKLFSWVEIRSNKVPISHLQYADDTIFFGSWSLENIENLMKLLKCFELSSGLKVNYFKSNLFGVGVDKKEVEETASLFCCKVGSFPFIYLGLSIGAKMSKISSWKPVIEKFEKSVRKKLECVRHKFFWGGAGNEVKISWVKWDDVFRSWADGELNVNVIKSIYGSSRLLNFGGNNTFACCNTTWSNILKAGLEIDNSGVDFTKSFAKVIGNGNNTKFWDDTWIMDKPLKETFKRLVRLESNPNASVAARVSWVEQKAIFKWDWSRVVTGRTKGKLDELETLLASMIMDPKKKILGIGN
ncbi:uncharacterized protein [Rutidosis leptorrhynchoides]|uniref:uncharacterized protein n=1 Tax=Rutidosis leptorrhynchoides TaxID=125765 RepID=UPI003A98EFD5